MNECLEYTVLFETGPSGTWSAYVPDLPGCVAAADTRDETAKLIREAIAFHIRGLRESGEPVPPPTVHADTVSVAA